MSGTEVWGATQIREWLVEPLRDANAEWTDNPERSWADVSGHLLEKLDLQQAEDFPVIEQLFAHLEQLATDDERKAFLLDESTRDELISAFAEQYERDNPPEAEAEAAADPEPYWDEENQRYLRWDAAADEWVPMEAEAPATAAAEPEPYWDEENQRYLRWDAAANEWVPMEPQAPDTAEALDVPVVADSPAVNTPVDTPVDTPLADAPAEETAVVEYASTVTDQVIDEFTQGMPDLAAQLGISEAELTAELADITPDEAATAIVEAIPEAS